jgi:hypothetical protein
MNRLSKMPLELKIGSRKITPSISLTILIFLSIAFILSLSSLTSAQKKTVETARKEAASTQKKPAQVKSSKELPGQKAAAANLTILKENKFLEEELNLAKKSEYYFIINLKDKKIELRARGMVLKSWMASSLRYSGKPVPLKVTALAQKSALNPPKRKMLKPGENQEKAEQTGAQPAKSEQTTSTSPTADNFELEALEITDMPGSYELILDNNLEISVRSKAKGKERIKQTKETILWYTWLPVKNYLSRKKEPNPRMIVYFDNPREAQGIYWAFIDGLKGLVWLP